MSVVLQENGMYSLVDNEFGWPIANGTKKEMLYLRWKIENA